MSETIITLDRPQWDVVGEAAEVIMKFYLKSFENQFFFYLLLCAVS